MDGEKIACRYVAERVDSFIDKDEQGRDLFFVVNSLYQQGNLETFLKNNPHVLCTELIIEWSTNLLIGAHALYR